MALVALAAALPFAAQALWQGRAAAFAATPSMGFSPPGSTYGLGVTPVPTVDVVVADANGIAGYDAWVGVSGSAAQLNSLADSGFLSNPNAQGTPQNVVVCATPTITASYGHLSCSVLPLPSPFPPPVLPSAGTTPAALVHAAFNPVAGGSSQLALTAVAAGTPETTALFDANGTPIAASLGGGSITVSGGVGGIAEMPDLAALRAPRAGGGDSAMPFAIAAAGAVAVAGGFAAWPWRAGQR
ncbi:MAG TPA: hypothetical protein VEZ14_03665 [Dehalococcoidia bacterium]|nr:hypothetical protein [Dehalococcoidia bacterium]